MDLEVSEQPGKSWDKSVSACDGNIYHSRGWAESAARSNGKPLYFTWRDTDGSVMAISTGQWSTSRLPLIKRWNSQLTMGSLPAITEEHRGRATEMLIKLRNYAKRNGCRSLDIESHMCQAISIDADWLKATTSQRIEFRLDITPPEEDIWREFKQHHKRKIKKAQKQDMEVLNSSSPDGVTLLRNLQQRSRDRRVDRGEEIGSGNDARATALMKRLLDANLARLFFVRVGDDIVSGALISQYRGRAFYVFGGSSPTGFSLDAPGLLFWNAIQYYKAEKFTEFNLGAVPADGADSNSPSHGLYRFKSGFGAHQIERQNFHLDLRPRLTSAIRITSRALGRA